MIMMMMMMMILMLMKMIMFTILTKQHTPHYYFTYRDVFLLLVFVLTTWYFMFIYLFPSLSAGYVKDLRIFLQYFLA
jgi:hypothetical protein